MFEDAVISKKLIKLVKKQISLSLFEQIDYTQLRGVSSDGAASLVFVKAN